ncbi:hypothetical protein BASA81_001355 [Batrachochytrium salamandrivorans]|nr:hypothetical protein BASA81_001355 [Batrachochytrium salamandrivorans]
MQVKKLRTEKLGEEEEDEDERMLKSVLFGTREWFGHDDGDEEADAEKEDNQLFSLDTGGSSAAVGGAAWEDSDDEDVTVNLATTDRLRKLRQTEKETEVSGKEFTERLREQHAKLASAASATGVPASNWAKLPLADHEIDEDEAALKQASSLLNEKVSQHKVDGVSADGKVSAKKLDDCVQPSNCVIQALDWHSHSSNVFLTGGMDKTLRLFQLSGRKENKPVQSVYFADLPISCAQFCESEVIVTGRRPYYYAYDVEAGKLSKVQGILGRRLDKQPIHTFATKPRQHAFVLNNGYVSIVDSRSRMETGYCKSGSFVRDLRFVGETNLVTAGSDAEIRSWDLRNLDKPVWKRVDEGSSQVTALACTESMYAVGSDNGIVSVYGMEQGNKIKQVMNLATWIDSLDFNASGAMLAMCSREKQGALRLLHLPTNQVVSNFPDIKAKLHKVQKVRFSKRGGVLSCGNDRGTVMMWKGFAM